MAIYFVQHGVALPVEVNPDRPLSPEGRKEVELISGYLGRLGISVGKICHSGKTRARETAQIFAGQIGGGNICELPGMNPGDDARAFAATLQEDNVMYVGHLPHLEKLVSHLLAGDVNAGVVKFVNGGVVCLAKDSSGFHIEWYLTPAICRG